MSLDSILAVVNTVTMHIMYSVGPVVHHVNYVLKYESHVENLRKNVEKLKSAQVRVQHSVDDARNNGEVIEEDVIKWLSDVEATSKRLERVLVDVEGRTKKCFLGLYANIKTLYQSGKKANKEMMAVDALLRERNEFGTISHRGAPQGMMEGISFRGYQAMQSRMPVFNEIMNALTTAEVTMVGVYGMGGMGKTTLVKEVARQATKYKLFDKIVIATITQSPDIRKIQGQIADQLGLKFEEESEWGRADRLRQRLKQEPKMLVILDDLWERLDLEAVGIPLSDEHKGWKMLLTSREFDVLSSGMDIQKNFSISALSEEEAWHLFKKVVGDDVEHPALQSMAIEVVKECAGLPVAIVAVSRALKGKSLSQWKNALRELKRPSPRNFRGVQEEVYAAMELSYNHLESKELKSTFLLCSRMGFNASIRDLLKYGIGLGLFSGIVTLEEAQDRVHSLVHKLKASGLLLDSGTSEWFSMHDVVRGVAVSIACRDCHVIFEKGDGEPKWPDKKTLTKCTEIWLSSNVIELPKEIFCPKLKLLNINSEAPSLDIADSFFRGMQKLKVLGLTSFSFLSLPSSLRSLKNLKSLCFDKSSLQEIAVIGELKKLEILSFVKCSIKHLPRQIGQLTRLRLLDLTDCSDLELIPPNVISSLSLLEELCMVNSFKHWDTEGRHNASLVELEHLSHLTNLEIHVPDSQVLSKDMFSRRLERYKVLIGHFWDWDGAYETSRTLKLKLNTSADHLEHGVLMLLKRTEDLYLLELKGVNNVVSELDMEGFPQLRHLHLHDSPQIQYIVSTGDKVPTDVFPMLESLALHNLISLENICHGALREQSFSKLRSIEVVNCDKLKHLFSLSAAKGLLQLQTINVSFCLSIEVIVAVENETADVMEFTKLSSLSLQCLPNLQNFCSREKTSWSRQAQSEPGIAEISTEISENELRNPMQLFHGKAVFPNLKGLELHSISVEKIWHGQLPSTNAFSVQNLQRLVVNDCHSLRHLFSSSMVKSLVLLEHLTVHNCKSMEEIIIVDNGLQEEETKSKMLLHKLEDIELSDLPLLTRFCTGDLIECPLLNRLCIHACPELKTFIQSFKCANMIVGIEPPELFSRKNCQDSAQPLFDDKVAFPNLAEIKISSMENLEKLWHNHLATGSFCELRSVIISSCKQLVNIFPSVLLRRFKMLEKLNISHCHTLEQIFDLHNLSIEEIHASDAFQLRDLSLIGLCKLQHIWNTDPQGICNFHNLHAVWVSECEVLRSLFPFSIARELMQLEKLKIECCGELEEIVAKVEDDGAAHNFVFPQLISLKLEELPKFRNFCRGKQTWECPKLKSLAVSDCGSIMLFGSEFGNSPRVHGEIQLDIQIQPPLFFVEKVITNLEKLSLGGKDTTASFIWSCQLPSESYSMLKVLNLHHFGSKSEPISFSFLQRLCNLETLSVTHSSFKKLFSYGGHSSFKNILWSNAVADKWGHAGMLAQLRNLVIHSVHDIKHLWEQDNLLFPVLQNLRTLKIENCERLSKLKPSSVSFQNLATLNVRSCNDLSNLITSSTAKSLAQLVKLTVAHCRMVTEIIAAEGKETNDDIIFSKLEYLELLDLQNLTSFSLGKHTLKFPSLKEMVLEKCPKMRIFSPGVLSTPKLQRVCWKKYSKNKVHWQGHLDTTVQHLHADMVGFDGVTTLKLSDFPQLKERWHGQLASNFFSSLIELVVDECAFPNALPSALLHVLKNLQKLQLKKCDLQEVFDLEGFSAKEGRVWLLDLNELHLIDLPRLQCISNKDLQGILDFRNLNFLEVNDCGNLRNIFTASMALSLVQLQKVVIRNCALMEEIVAKERAEEVTVNKIIFPMLKRIVLESLPNLTNIYSGSGILNLTSLEDISIENCPNMKVFVSSILREPEPNPVAEGKEQTPCKRDHYVSTALPHYKVSLQSLKRLRVDWNHITDMVQHGQFQAEFLYKLNILELVHFPTGDLFPFRFLQGFTNLENLVLSDASFKEIFLHEETSGVEKDYQFLARLKELELCKLPKLIHMSKRGSNPCQIFQNLETLKVSECGTLKILVPSSIGFQCLMSLEVSKCHGLVALMTTSTVRNLVQLTSMSITECKRIKEIISNEEDEAEDMVVFHKLECVRLHCLPCLKGFHLQNTALMFPCLEKVFLNECPKMNFFSQGVINTAKLERVQLAEGDNVGYWKGGLNLTVQKLFKKKGAHSELPSSSNQPILSSEASTEDENQMRSVPKEPGSEDLHLNDNTDANKDLPPATKTNAQHIMEEKTIENASVEPAITELASAHQDSLATSNDKDHKEGPSQVEISSASADIEMISPQAQKNSQPSYEDHFMPVGTNKERGVIPVSPAFGVDFVSTSASPTKATIAQKLAPHTALRPSSETPSLLLREIESLFAVMEQSVSSCAMTSSQPSSSANCCAQSCESTGESFETYRYSMDLVKKILTKPLTEVARSHDGLLLLATLKNLKNCHLLNSRQLEIVKDYIENSDLLVTNHPLYEHQIERTSSLKVSIENKEKGISDLKNRYEGLISNVKTLSAEKEALIKRLGEIQEEENHIQEDAEDLHARLVNWKGELETHVKALPEAVRQQNEAKHRVSYANDNWAKIRSLFA